MFQNIRRHQKWLWIVISGLVIISFVWYFNPNNQQGVSAGGDVPAGTINGRPISLGEYRDAYEEATLRYLFSYGEWPGNDEMTRSMRPVERETRTRLFLKEKVKEMDIKVSDDAVAQWIAQAFRDRETQTFRKASYDNFVKEVLPRRGLEVRDFERFARNEVAFQHLITLASLPGRMITPQAAEVRYREEHEKVEAQAVFFSASNFVSKVNIDPGAIATFYTNNASAYRIPDRIQVSYVTFDLTNYFAQAEQRMNSETNLSQRIDQIYTQRGTNYFVDTNGMMLSPEVAKAQIRDEVREAYALIDARAQANKFMEELLELPGPRQAANLENLAAARGITSKLSQPFTEFEQPPGMKVVDTFSRMMFRLSEADPFPDEPTIGEDAVYVAAFKKRIPSELPSLDSIRAKVTDDYQRQQSQTLARLAGNAFHNTLTNGLAQGKSFAEITREAGYTPLALTPFTQTDRTIPEMEARQDFASVKNVAFALGENQTSGFTTTRDGGFIVHVNRFLKVDDATVKAELASYMETLRRGESSDAFNDWFRKEMASANLVLATDKEDAAAMEQ